jgi:hypothetical protein
MTHIDCSCLTDEKRYNPPDNTEPARIFVQDYNGCCSGGPAERGNPIYVSDRLELITGYIHALRYETPGKFPYSTDCLPSAQMH